MLMAAIDSTRVVAVGALGAEKPVCVPTVFAKKSLAVREDASPAESYEQDLV
jgi:hypothetical protein